MMARSLPRRTRAIRLVIRTGCIPGRNTTWSEFCDLVRIAVRVGETSEDINRRRRAILVRGEPRVLPLPAWGLFEALYAGRGEPVSGEFLRKAIGVLGLSKHLHQLRRALAGSRYRVETHRDLAYELRIDQE